MKNGTVFVKKASITSSEQEKDLLIQVELFQSEAIFMLNISAKCE